MQKRHILESQNLLPFSSDEWFGEKVSKEEEIDCREEENVKILNGMNNEGHS